MPGSAGERLRERIQRELAEADVEIGFNLVDLAAEEYSWGDFRAASRALADAEEVFRDLKKRLLQLGAAGSAPFEPLVTELRRTIDVARRRN